MAWFVNTNYHGKVKLSAYSLTDHSPVYFETGDQHNNMVTTAELDSATPGGIIPDFPDKWAFFPTHIWVSKAGCYRIQAEWDSGSWQQVIAIGSKPS